MRADLIKKASLVLVLCAFLSYLAGTQFTPATSEEYIAANSAEAAEEYIAANSAEAAEEGQPQLQPQPPSSRIFSDVTPDYPESGYINYLARQGLISGYPNGTYGSLRPATRAQVAAILVKALGLSTSTPNVTESLSVTESPNVTESPIVTEVSFYDVPSEHWAYPAIRGLVQAGVMTGYPDGSFGPDQMITRAEAAALAGRLAAATGPGSSPGRDSSSHQLELPDVSAEHWAFSRIQAALERGSLTLRWNKRFEPQAVLNRGELARLIVGTLYPQELGNLASVEPAKVAYLTFDDGPSAQITPRILDVAAQYDVPVTFFVLGSQATRYPDLVQQAVQAGHAVGNHSYSHRYAQIYYSEKSLMQEVSRTNDVLVEVIGYEPTIFRAPGGSTLMSKRQAQRLREEGYRHYDWNVSPGDASGTYRSAQSLITSTLNQARGKDRIIVLFHDSPSKKNTVDALPAIIEGLKKMGFSFAAINPQTEPFQFRKG